MLCILCKTEYSKIDTHTITATNFVCDNCYSHTNQAIKQQQELDFLKKERSALICKINAWKEIAMELLKESDYND